MLLITELQILCWIALLGSWSQQQWSGVLLLVFLKSRLQSTIIILHLFVII